MFKLLFKDPRFKPDQLKIYPCQVIKGAKLVSLYEKKSYKPYSEKQIKEIIIKIMRMIPNYCRVMRIMREIPPEFLIAGTTRIDLRKDIESEIKKRKIKIQEIRFREIGFEFRDNSQKESINQELKLKVTKYKASCGEEYFLEIINKNNILFGLCRLRIEKNRNFAIIRELHVYGQSLPIGMKGRNIMSQHKGLGRKLVLEAEKIAREKSVKELFVIAGVGVRQYFYNLGYSLKGDYVSKSLNS